MNNTRNQDTMYMSQARINKAIDTIGAVDVNASAPILHVPSPAGAPLTEEKIKKYLTKLAKNPETRRVTPTKGRDLLVQGRREVLNSWYLLSSPWGTWAKVNGLPLASKSQTTVASADFFVAISDDRCLLSIPDMGLPGVYWSKKCPPLEGEYFLLFVWNEDYVEFFAVTPRMPNVLHFLQPMETGRKVFGLCIDLLMLYAPAVEQEFSNFCEEVGIDGKA